jgi:hypothetical protein
MLNNINIINLGHQNLDKIKDFSKYTFVKKSTNEYYIVPLIRGERQREAPPPHTPTEYANNLLSTTELRIQDLISEGEIAGFVVKSGAYGSDPLCSTYFDDTPVRNLDGSFNFGASGAGFSFDYTNGTSNQSVIPGFERVENIIPLSSNTRVANPPYGQGSVKNVIVSFNTNAYPDIDTAKVTVKVAALAETLLGPKEVAGDTVGYRISYAIDVSVNDGVFITVIENTINGKCTSPYLKSHSFSLPKTNPASSYYKWKIRVRRTSQNVLLSRVLNELYVENISVISNSQFNYPNTALVALKLNAEQFSSIPVRAYEIKGLLVNVPQGYTPTTYQTNGTIVEASYPNIWLGNFDSTKKWTDNPAWIYYDILTNKRYGLGNYIQSEWIDKWTLYEIAQYCDELVEDGKGGMEPRFTCNIVIQERQDAYNLLLNLASVFRGMLYWANGRLFANTTNNTAPVYTFTNANVINGRFNYSDTAKNTRSTVIKVRWNDPESLYRENLEYIEDTQGIAKYGYITKDITAFACTSKGQAYRIANWAIQTEQASTETITFQAGMEGSYLRPGDSFTVYDNFRNNQFQGGRTVSYTTGIFGDSRAEIVLDRPVYLKPNYTYTLTAVIPKYNIEATGDITGSNQASFIRNAQIENIAISNVRSGNKLILETGYSTGVYKNAIWTLNNSGISQLFDHGEIGGSVQIKNDATEMGVVPSGVFGNAGYINNSSTTSPFFGGGFVLPHRVEQNVQDFTIEFWIKRLDGSWGINRRVVQKEPFFSNYLDIATPSSVLPSYSGTIAYRGTEVRTNTILEPGQWVHVAFSRKNNTGIFYCNGLLDNTGIVASNFVGGSGPILIGHSSATNEYWQNILIDEFRLWNYARSSGEIYNNYNLSISNTPSGLINYITFDNSGSPITINDQSKIYRCLATSEIEPGIVEVLGVEYSSGINASIETDYSVVNNPINSGDNSPIDPPTGFLVQLKTGVYSNNSFYQLLALSWYAPNASNLSYYTLSGLEFGGTWENFDNPASTGSTFNIATTGLHEFKIAAVSLGGRYSTFVTANYVVPAANPLGSMPPLENLVIDEDFNPYMVDGNGDYTGYFGRTPTFAWQIPTGLNGLQVPEAQFISGFSLRLLNSSNVDLVSPIIVGATTNSVELEGTTIESFAGGPQRFFKARVDIIDDYGVTTQGAVLSVNNPPPRPPTFSGFNAGLGGFNYSITPDGNDIDLTGIYFWSNTGLITPNFTNFSSFSPNFAGFSFNSLTGSYNIWFALADTFGTGNTPIYGPIQAINNFGVTGISVNKSNPPLQGLIDFSGLGNVTISRNLNTILISGSGANSSTENRDFFNLSFYLDSVQSGLYIGEALNSKNFIFTGYSISCRTSGSALTGILYTDSFINNNNVPFATLNLGHQQYTYNSGGYNLSITGNRKIGFSITNNVTGISKLSIGVFGYNVGI